MQLRHPNSLWKQQQQHFRGQLARMRREQLESRSLEHYCQLGHWRQQEEQWQRWRRHCSLVCPDCGYKKCACKMKPTDELICKLLRRLAGFNADHNIARRVLDENNNGGLVGYRSCPAAAFENAVRLYEDL